MSSAPMTEMKVAEIESVAPQVKRFRLERPDGGRVPNFSAGSHVVVTMRDGDRTRRNPYSLMGCLADNQGYEISVLKVTDSRGGSRFMHDCVSVGDLIGVTPPVNLFPIDFRARKYIFAAGGIGITPFIPMLEQVAAMGRTFELHYAMRDEARGAYAAMLRTRYGERVRQYRSSLGERICVERMLENQPLGTHFYVCGPEQMAESFLSAALAMGWPEQNVHVERFAAPPAGLPFRVRLDRSGVEVDVGEHESLLDAIERAGVQAPFLCRGGACGACETRVIACTGDISHNDHYLGAEDRIAGKKIMICVSRLKGRELVLDL